MQVFRDEATAEAVRIIMMMGYDLHVHWRSGDMLRVVAKMTARQFEGAVLMPNLIPPLTTAEQLAAYRHEATAALATIPEGTCDDFRPLMMLYITDSFDFHEIEKSVPYGLLGMKYYPPGLTTNSENGVKSLSSLWTKGTQAYEALRALADVDRTLLLHAANALDANGEELDPYDQEKDFVFESLPRIRDAHPNLRITFEHLSTSFGAEYMRGNGGPKLGCTITAQRLLLDRRDTHRKGFYVHRHWWPIIQRKEHRAAVRDLAGSSLPFVFLGTDSAPHPIASKETACCVGGVLTAHCAMELYAEAFEDMGKLDKLENFASVFGPQFYGLPPSKKTVTLEKKEWEVPETYQFTKKEGLRFEESHLRPFRYGETTRWKQVLS